MRSQCDEPDRLEGAACRDAPFVILRSPVGISSRRDREPRQSVPATLPIGTVRISPAILNGMNTTSFTESDSSAPPQESARPARSARNRSAPRSLSGWFFRRPRSHLLARAISPATLAAAWSRVRRNGGVAGGDGVSCRAFERHARDRLARLRRALLAGDYAPGPVRRVEIVKEDGGTRPLAIPCVADRVAQTAVAFALTPLLEPAMSPASFGYRPGLGVADAVARVDELRRENRIWILESDVARFFETVPHSRLLALLDARTGDSLLTELVASWLDRAGVEGCGLLQGSPLSPLLANLYLDEIDHLLDGPEGRLVRYADDFVVLSTRKADAEAAKERAATLLEERGLALHPDKTRIGSFEDGFWFLGHYFIKNLVLRDLARTPEAAPPVWEQDVPGAEPETEERKALPKRPAFARVSETLLGRLIGRRAAP